MRIDMFGRDPLSENFATTLSYWPHTVTAAQHQNPQAIARQYYNTVDMFGIILEYNGLVHQCEVLTGMQLMVPVLTQDIIKQDLKEFTV